MFPLVMLLAVAGYYYMTHQGPKRSVGSSELPPGVTNGDVLIKNRIKTDMPLAPALAALIDRLHELAPKGYEHASEWAVTQETPEVAQFQVSYNLSNPTKLLTVTGYMDTDTLKALRELIKGDEYIMLLARDYHRPVLFGSRRYFDYGAIMDDPNPSKQWEEVMNFQNEWNKYAARSGNELLPVHGIYDPDTVDALNAVILYFDTVFPDDKQPYAPASRLARTGPQRIFHFTPIPESKEP